MNPKERVTTSIEIRTPVAEPIEIFPGPQETQKPTFKRTRLMQEVEEVIQEDLPEFLRRSCFVEGLSQRDILQVIRNKSEGHIQIWGGTISDWQRRFNIPVRSKPEAAKLAWQNPDKRKRKIEETHSPTADGKRSETMHNKWEDYSELEKRVRRTDAREGRRKALLRRMRETLGEDPTERLREMCGRLSASEIAEELGVSSPTVRKWKKNLGIETIKAGETPGHIKTNKEEKQHLVGQARANGLIEMLPEEEQFVINARFPIEGGIKRHVEIGRSLYPDRPKIDRQWPQQIEKRALQRFAAALNTT